MVICIGIYKIYTFWIKTTNGNGYINYWTNMINRQAKSVRLTSIELFSDRLLLYNSNKLPVPINMISSNPLPCNIEPIYSRYRKNSLINHIAAGQNFICYRYIQTKWNQTQFNSLIIWTSDEKA